MAKTSGSMILTKAFQSLAFTRPASGPSVLCSFTFPSIPFRQPRISLGIATPTLMNLTADVKLRPKVLIITGPTAVGKSSTALGLCRRLDGEIVSADSVQVYKHLDVASNKTSQREREAVPHHLIDIADPAQDEFTAGDFFRAARTATHNVLSRGRLPVIVGGTMMYVRWFMHGRPATPPAPEAVRQRVEKMVAGCEGDWESGLKLLAIHDLKRTERLSPNDWYRLTRALEIVETTGTPMTEMPLQGAAPKADGQPLDFDFRCIFLVGDRRSIYRTIDERCEYMILPLEDHDGDREIISILTEVSALLALQRLRVGASSPSRAIGYRQTISYLLRRAVEHANNNPKDSALPDFRAFLDDFQTATRNYAKQQISWFRKENMFLWVKSGPHAVDSISDIIGMNEEEYTKFYQDESETQVRMKEDMIAQGRQMKTYIPERKWLTIGSEAELNAVQLAEQCAEKISLSIPLEKLQDMLTVV